MTVRQRFSITRSLEYFILRTGLTDDADSARFFAKSVSIAVWTSAAITVAGTLGVDTKPLVTGLGVTGVTIGFALRDIAHNFISGMLLMLQRPFGKGSHVRVHINSVTYEGCVCSIDIRNVLIDSKDGGRLIIPSAMVYANPITVLNVNNCGKGEAK